MLIKDRKLYITSFFFFLTQMSTGLQMYLSQTLDKGLLLFTDGQVNMVQHHLTDEVSDPASLSVFFFFPLPIADKKKKTQLPTVPGVYSCQRLDCTATNQPLSGKVRLLKATASGRTGPDNRPVVTFAKVTIIHVCGCPTGMKWEQGKKNKKLSCHMTSPRCFN